METTTKVKIIDEIRNITAEQVAKKQDDAKLNYPKIIEKIKIAANRGESFALINDNEMNEYDMKLLQKDGFTVYLTDEPKIKYKSDYFQSNRKVWRVSW